MQNVLELNFNPKIVIACSSAQYGTRNFEELPLKEENLFKPDHIYGLSKYFQNLLANQYFKMFNLKVINAIIFNTSGPGKIMTCSLIFLINTITDKTEKKKL